MTAAISTTYDSKYLFYLPITTWLWNKIGVDAVYFAPVLYPTIFDSNLEDKRKKLTLVSKLLYKREMHVKRNWFISPEDKSATYAQCSRLYAAALDLPENEMLITSDIDMVMFNLPLFNKDAFTIVGADLTGNTQFPMCYAIGSVKNWRKAIGEGSYQQHLDKLLGGLESENFRGNHWAKDQEQLKNIILASGVHIDFIPRSQPDSYLASSRVDRDDMNWRAHTGPNLTDAHLWRPGYEEEPFNNLLELLSIQYPEEDLEWIRKYRLEYLKLL